MLSHISALTVHDESISSFGAGLAGLGGLFAAVICRVTCPKTLAVPFAVLGQRVRVTFPSVCAALRRLSL